MKHQLFYFFSKVGATARTHLLYVFAGFVIVPSVMNGQSGDPGGGAQRHFRWTMTAGPVISSQRWLEKNFSLLSYSGPLAGAAINAAFHKRNAYLQLNASFQSGNAQTRYKEVPAASLHNYTLTFQNGYCIINNGAGNFVMKAGSRVSVFYVGRQYKGFVNNSHSFESSFAVAPFIEGCAQIGRETKQLLFSVSLAVPVIASIAQPSYGTDALPVNGRGEQGYSLTSFINANQIVSINRYFQLNARFLVTKRFGYRHAMVFDYQPSYYQISTDREVRSANQLFSLCYQYCF